jgi:hypothetical protein
VAGSRIVRDGRREEVTLCPPDEDIEEAIDEDADGKGSWSIIKDKEGMALPC